jgi:hypothetical protein
MLVSDINRGRIIGRETNEVVVQACLLLERVRTSVMSSVAGAPSMIVAPVWLRLKTHIILTIKITESIKTITATDSEDNHIPGSRSTSPCIFCTFGTAKLSNVSNSLSPFTFGPSISIIIRILSKALGHRASVSYWPRRYRDGPLVFGSL